MYLRDELETLQRTLSNKHNEPVSNQMFTSDYVAKQVAITSEL